MFAATSNSVIEDDARIDVIMTHSLAKYRLDRSHRSRERIGCLQLFRAIRRSIPALHIFGHGHGDYGVEVVKWAGDGKVKLPEDDGADDGIQHTTRVKGTNSPQEKPNTRRVRFANMSFVPEEEFHRPLRPPASPHI
jgi:hypothetical protein